MLLYSHRAGSPEERGLTMYTIYGYTEKDMDVQNYDSLLFAEIAMDFMVSAPYIAIYIYDENGTIVKSWEA